MMWGYGYGNSMFGFGFLGVLFSILWFVFLVWAIVTALRWITGKPPRRHWMMQCNGALDILRERYAKGEIDKQEFEEKQKVLSQG